MLSLPHADRELSGCGEISQMHFCNQSSWQTRTLAPSGAGAGWVSGAAVLLLITGTQSQGMLGRFSNQDLPCVCLKPRFHTCCQGRGDRVHVCLCTPGPGIAAGLLLEVMTHSGDKCAKDVSSHRLMKGGRLTF